MGYRALSEEGVMRRPRANLAGCGFVVFYLVVAGCGCMAIMAGAGLWR
jgi:hypothetical protein